MNIAVLKYQFVSDKPSGMPDAWPAETIHLNESTDLPGENWVLMTQEEYDAHISSNVTAYNAWAASHYAPDIPKIVANRIKNAMEFGRDIMAEYGASNVLSGLTLVQIKYVMDVTIKLQAALSTGSLYVALDELAAIQVDGTIIHQQQVDDFRHKIQDYLGITRT